MSTINDIQNKKLHSIIKKNIVVIRKLKYFMQDNEAMDTIQKAMYSIMSSNNLKTGDLYNMSNKEFMSAIDKAIEKENNYE